MTFVTSGEQALERLREDTYDVIVSDMRMPTMDGATLLAHVKQHHPNVIRIVLSGHSELEAAVRAIPMAHQFLSKPCDPKKLKDVLSRATSLEQIIEDAVVREVLGSLQELPARPKIYTALEQLLRDEKAPLSRVAELVEQDIAISTKLLHIVNTAFFSRGRSISSVREAVPRLGGVFVKNLVLATEVFRSGPQCQVPGFSIDALHEHSLLTGAIARRLLEMLGKGRWADEAFLAGTLHDLGKLVLASAQPQQLAASLQGSVREGRPLSDMEYSQCDAGHAEVGAYLLELWGLPYAVTCAVANHHRPGRVEEGSCELLGFVHLANGLAHEVDGNDVEGAWDRAYLEQRGLLARMDEWRAVAAEVAEGLRET